MLFVSVAAEAQIVNPGERVPAGAIVYSLPFTTIHLEVEAEYEEFIAGPYAGYAKKYLGVDVRTDDEISHSVSSVNLTPFIEADPATNIALYLGNNRNASANFLEMINQGLIMWSDSYSGKSEKMRYPSLKSEDVFSSSMSSENLVSEKTTLYRTARSNSGTERVAVQQSQIVEKSAERRAEEAAAQIFHLREKRLNIITGDTDATFSGDALRAAVEEITRLEQEYLSLFMGKSTYGKQVMSFDVVPRQENEKQIYIAFRISERSGLLPANDLSGRPVVLELIPEGNPAPVNMEVSQKNEEFVLYRKPAMINARLLDGQSLLIQSRIPVYQLGSLLSFPLGVATGRL
jgi:hypothetical protein